MDLAMARSGERRDESTHFSQVRRRVVRRRRTNLLACTPLSRLSCTHQTQHTKGGEKGVLYEEEEARKTTTAR